MPALFGLLTGVQNYHPDSKVNALSGCVNDVNGIAAFLQKKFAAADLHLVTLLNEAANRKNFIDSFISHLVNNPLIKKDDIVLFYYSGHGSYETSNPAFIQSDSQAQDETMVLYDSRCPGNFDLADKELGLLISNIPAHAHIVIIMDSCHSGSATRSVDDLDAILLGKPKHQPAASDGARKLPDYLTVNGNGYAQMLDANGKTTVPAARYIALAACDRHEVAYESPASPQGMFTGMLLQALNTGQTNLSYAQLFEYLHTLLKRKARQQTPQLEVYEGFDPNTVVFDTATAAGKNTYSVVKQADGSITINCGALHGINNDPAVLKKLTVTINDNGTHRPASFTAVGLDTSELAVSKLSTQLCEADIINFSPATSIFVSGTQLQQKDWEKKSADLKKENLDFVYEADQYHDYILQFNEHAISLKEKISGALVHGVAAIDDDAVLYMISCCNQVCAWHKLHALRNYAVPEKTYRNNFKTRFGIALMNATTQDWELQEADELLLYIDEDHPKIPFRILLDTASAKGLYCAVYYMSSRFGITKLSDTVTSSVLKKGQPLALSENTNRFSMYEEDDEITDYFKLVISTEPFKDYLVNEYDELERKIVDTSDAKAVVYKNLDKDAVDQNWYAETISVTLRKNTGKISGNKAFNSGKLTIHGNDALAATASVAAMPSKAKSIHPSQQLQQLMESNGYQVINLGNSKSADAGPAVVFLEDIQISETDKTPLRLTLEELPADDEAVMAVTMQDGVVQVLGLGIANGNAYELEADLVPETDSKKKSLLGSAWFCFVKVVLRKDLTKLRAVHFENGKPFYGDKNVKDIIQPGMRVAVLIHGIIGDSGGIAPAMEFLLTGNYYDLVLALDYENLHTKIEEIAVTTKTLLENAGAGPGKPVDIICHSMGGLVSRYMIEHIDGTHLWIKRLYMFGTPNAGSVFGKLPAMRDWTVSLLTLACNLGAQWLGAAGPILSVVNKVLGATKTLTITLAEMEDSSDFYKLLNKPDWKVQTRYHVIAGNVLAFKPADDDGRFYKIMEKIKRQIGEWAYSSTKKNDIAVATTSILTVPAQNTDSQIELACHHLNYFDLDITMDYFKKLVAANNGG